jgi:hypothetical protein
VKDREGLRPPSRVIRPLPPPSSSSRTFSACHPRWVPENPC